MIVEIRIRFFRFREKNFREFGFQTRGNKFSRISCTLFEVTLTEAIWSFSLHRLQPISFKFSNVKKLGVTFCGIFVGGSLFSRDLIIADQ